MFATAEYELLDFGGGRKLERFGPYVLDRPCPAAESESCRLSAADWREAFARYVRTNGEGGTWSTEIPPPGTWTIQHGTVSFELKLTPFGHVGVFPEQAEQWDWIDEQVRTAGRPQSILNLFAHTGGSTLTAAVAGAAVAHVDAAQNTVAWARRNATSSGLVDRPIRWLVEDALKFVQRELRRGNRYDGVILDPPSFGHGSRGESWQIDTQLADLLALSGELMAGRRGMALVTCHSPGWGAGELRALLTRTLASHDSIECGCTQLICTDGRRLDCGAFARVSASRGSAR